MPYTASPFPEDYPTRDVFKGINIYNTIPNRYPYMYDRQPFPGLYYNDEPPCHKKRQWKGCREPFGEPIRRTPKVFPYTNRPWLESTVYTSPKYYESLLDNLDLRPAYTFYTSDCFLL